MTWPIWRLRTQLVALVILSFLAGQVLSLLLFADERSSAVQAALGAEAAGRAANVVQLLEAAPVELHEQIVAAASSPLVRFSMDAKPNVQDGEHHGDVAIAARIRALMGENFTREVRVEVHEIDQTVLPVPNLTPEMAEIHADMMRGTLAAVELEIAIALSGGGWLNVKTNFERPPWQATSSEILSLLLSAGLGVAAVLWFAIARVTGPLQRLEMATDAMGKGGTGDPLPLRGPREVRSLTKSFDVMKSRLRRFVTDRTMVLAALAHDLRSPLTALRVQSELVEDAETRMALTRSVDEMSEMVEATLAYARGVGSEEERSDIRMRDLLDRSGVLMTEQVDSLDGDLRVRVRVNAVVRALRNLVENARRYGEHAQVSWASNESDLSIWVLDDGPGIPEHDLERVCEPYVRLDPSRSRSTGGTGLGLSISRSVALAHGGVLVLSNREMGGLSACLDLPGAIVSKPLGNTGVKAPGSSELG